MDEKKISNRINILNEVFSTIEERKNSKVKKRTLEPFWKEYFDVSVEGDLEPQVLKIQCDDWDLVIVQRRENFKTHDAARRSAVMTSWASAPCL